MASYLDTDGLSHLWLKLKSIFYQKPDGGIPKTHLATSVQTSLDKANSAYQKPDGGIPKTDMVSTVQTSLGKADSAYQKPIGGIPKSDLASSVQTSLSKADSSIQKHQDISGKLDKSGDTMSGNLNMGQYYISDVGELELDNGADSIVIRPAQFNGGLEVSGKIIAANPTSTGSDFVATKTYVDTSISSSERNIKDLIAEDIASAIDNALHLKKEVLSSGTLPEVSTASENVIYMLPVSGASGNNVYIEYMKINDKWEQIGSTDVDLSNYVTKTDVVAISNAEIDSIVDGT